MEYVMVIDLNQCIGCDSCTVSCKLEHATGTGIKWGRVEEEELGTFPSVRKAFVPLLCMHCEKPECLKVCPTGATYRNRHGMVLIDYDRCMGCKYCVIACPYMARFFNERRAPPEGVPWMEADQDRWGIVEKCDFCVDRIAEAKLPKCVESCPYDARKFGKLDDFDPETRKAILNHELVVLKEDDGYGPSVYYTKVK
jgi:Fe-S-cluster-containing dehydrogenase component